MISYFLTLTSFQPLYGKLSDIFSRKSCLLFAYTIFGLGCLWCGLAPNMTHLILARAFAGIGGGGMSTVVSIFFSDTVPLRERGKWQGYLNIIFATGSAAGPPLGGYLVDSIGWRWAFLIQVPLCVAAFIAVYFVVNLPAKGDEHWRGKLRRIDFLGAISLLAAVSLLLIAMDRGSNVSWTSTLTLACLAISIAMFIIFLFVETKIASEPFAPSRIIFERSLFACYLCNFFSMGGWMATLFYIPLKYQVVNGRLPIEAGSLLLPAVAAMVCGSLSGGIYMQRVGKYYWITIFGYTLLVTGLVVVLLFSGIILDSIIVVTVGLVACAYGNGIGVTTTLIGLSTKRCPRILRIFANCSSRKCFSRGSSHRNGVFIPFSVSWLYNGCLSLCDCWQSSLADATGACAQQR